MTVTRVHTQREETIALLARTLGFETTETRKSDSLDFRDISITSLMEALRAAYDAGRASR